MITVKDIGHLKLMSICARKAKKDLYDLDIITDNFHDLGTLMTFLSEREKRFDSDEAWWLFDLDAPQSPSEDFHLLLAAEPINYEPAHGRLNRSDDLLLIMEPYKSLGAARRSWRRKVFKLMRDNGIEPPSLTPVN
ncbi:hypothetical protein HNQ91_005879 [Filimonas zeae]|uniref:hypothetical protein n=1 Tax=Filimonas zeae TaxID=1737353 RepID=UPI00166564FB|nr:hypothetical protein [Filimonas zeae]MDR6342792.1 hypothetical protein [Filimonas zeae]